MGIFDFLPVYTLSKENPKLECRNHNFFNYDYPFLEVWIFGLLESFPSVSRDDIKSYILKSLNASIFSELDTIVD